MEFWEKICNFVVSFFWAFLADGGVVWWLVFGAGWVFFLRLGRGVAGLSRRLGCIFFFPVPGFLLFLISSS